jgi:hypothetical protein
MLKKSVNRIEEGVTEEIESAKKIHAMSFYYFGSKSEQNIGLDQNLRQSYCKTMIA